METCSFDFWTCQLWSTINAALETFFIQLNYIETNTCASLLSSSLNSLRHVKVTAPVLQEYHNEHVEKAVEFWYNAKNQRVQNKKKQKKYKQCSRTKNKHICFDLDALSSSNIDDSCSSSTSISGDEREE